MNAVPIARLAKINALSFFAQVVQIGTVPALLAVRLTAAHYSALVVGAIAAAPWIAILLVGRAAPRVLSRCGFRATHALAMCLALSALLGMMWAASPALLFTFNLLFGVGLILRWVSCDTWIVEAAPVRIRGRAIGVHETLMGCGIAMGPLIIALTGANGLTPFWVCVGVLGLSAAMLVGLGHNGETPALPARGSMGQAVRTMLTALVAGFLAGFVETSSISFLPVFSERSLFAIGVAFTLGGFGAGGTLLQVPLGGFADRFGYRAAQLVCCAIIVVGALSFPFIGHSTLTLLLMLFMWGGAAGGMNTLAVIEAGARMNEVAVSTAMAAIAMAYTTGSILGPLLVGLATSRWNLFGFLLAICSAIALFLGTLAAATFRRHPTHLQEAIS